MNQVEKQTDSIIAQLKLTKGLEGVRFVREYGSHRTETPVGGMLAVVSIADFSKSRGYIGGYLSSSIKGNEYRAVIEIRVYAPAEENGSGLSEIVGEILTGLKSADAEKIITDLSASSIEFDADMNAIFRTVSVEISFCLCEEG